MDDSIIHVLADQLGRMLDDYCDRTAIHDARSNIFPAAMWHEMDNMGLLTALSPEKQGGSGLAIEEMYPIFALLGYHGVAAPVVETMIANHVLGIFGVAAHSGPQGITADTAILEANGELSGQVRAIGGHRCDKLVLVAHNGDHEAVCIVERAEGCPEFVDLAGSPLAISNQRRRAGGRNAMLPLLAAVRSAQIAGLLRRLLEMSIGYALQRRQFGKTISQFQAVQHMLARLAAEAERSGAAAKLGLKLLASEPIFGAAVAKSVGSDAAMSGAALAHQIHGAIGLTEEFDLGHFTQLLRQFSLDAGSASYWTELAGRQLIDADGKDLWSSIVKLAATSDTQAA
jgi:acyl-CoA dehydrogenase